MVQEWLILPWKIHPDKAFFGLESTWWEGKKSDMRFDIHGSVFAFGNVGFSLRITPIFPQLQFHSS